MRSLENLEQGRASYRRRAWGDAYRCLSAADDGSPLAVEDLERLATAAYLTGRDEDFQKILERAHHARLASGEPERAARCAFWLGLTRLLRGETAQASGWLARARRLVEGRECVEHGYLLLPAAERSLVQGDGEGARAAADEAAGIGERFADQDLIACARHLQGRSLLRQGRVGPGLTLLDEAMLAVVAGELSPIVTGLVYCSVIAACQQVLALGRASEWTSALARWCEQQPQMVSFTDACLVHRAEIMQFHGEWPDAMAEARRACDRFSQGIDPNPPAAAFYRRAEIHRLRGEFDAAEAAYRDAGKNGWEPQPGLALLRSAQGRADAARAAIRRVLGAATEPAQRGPLLQSCVEIMLAAGDLREAERACRELEAVARTLDTEVMQAIAAYARGSVELAQSDFKGALASSRRAFELWRQAQAPYEAARARVLIALACRALGDEDASSAELAAARATFERLGATPELARLDALGKGAAARTASRLTTRELQVLRLIAAGKTNKAIAKELRLSERTIDRHVSNVLAKLDVPSRAAATAYAYSHRLL